MTPPCCATESLLNMAHLGFARTVYKSGGSGKARTRIEYITGRTVTPLDFAERQLRYILNGREDLVQDGSRNLPGWAGGNPHIYFQAAERHEGKGRVAFEEWKVSLPHELTRAQNEALIEDLLDTIAGESLPCTYAFHEPRTLSDSHGQPHIHLLISARRNDEYVRSAETHFKLWQAKEPGRGGARKDPAMNTQGAVKLHRLMISDILNVHLERAGQVARVHPDTLRSRGIERKAEPKLTPSESRAYRERGEISPTMQQVLDIRAKRVSQRARENSNARTYWEDRKAFLGITDDMPGAVQVARILLKRHGAVERVPARYRRYVGRSPHHVQRGASVRAQVARLARDLEGGEAHGGGTLRVRLHDEREQDRGMSW